MDKLTQDFIDNCLSSKWWRLNNLYTIKDKWGTERIMKVNFAQEKVAKHYRHNKKIILKSRQQGISTFYLAYDLDDCIFTPGVEAGIQSYGQNEADKLVTRAELMWNKLDPAVKEMLGVTLVKNNSTGLYFSNGSILKIGNFRGDTLQLLHVSELAKIAKKYPEKAKELKTGAFQAVASSNIITIESTAEGKSGLFYDMWNNAIRAKHSNHGLTALDFQPIFLSWVIDPDCTLDTEVPIPPDLVTYFDEVDSKLVDLAEFGCNIEVLTNKQKWWYTKKVEELGNDMKQEYPTFPDEAFAQSVEGTYYKTQYDKLLREQRFGTYPYRIGIPVVAIFDLGMDDTMAINMVQLYNGKPRIIGEYSNRGEGIEFYVAILQQLPYNVSLVYLPHDANVKELGTGRTRLETFRRLGVRCQLLRKLSLQEGINAARQYLSVVEIDESCKETIDSIQNYRQRFDDRLGVFLNQPVHDKFSHFADVIRYSAIALTYNKVSTSVQDKEVKQLEDDSKSIQLIEDDYDDFTV